MVAAQLDHEASLERTSEKFKAISSVCITKEQERNGVKFWTLKTWRSVGEASAAMFESCEDKLAIGPC